MKITFTSNYRSIELNSEKIRGERERAREREEANDDVSAALHNTESYRN